MRLSLVGCCVLGSVIAVVGCGATAATSGVQAGRPLFTAVVDPENFSGPEKQLAFQHVRAAGATFARLTLYWNVVAPGGAQQPSGFAPRNPGDPRYHWGPFDDQVRSATAAGLTPIVDIVTAPAWAQGGGPKALPTDGPDKPSPSALADFATAAARRYGGGFLNLPRVRYWQVWSEPNNNAFLAPQESGTALLSPDWYRTMVNAMSDAVHAVAPDNVVVAGALAPFGQRSYYDIVAPLRFMRALLCMSAGPDPRPTCKTRVEFDVWAHHPYTWGGPTHHAALPDDVSIGDLGKMRALLEAAARAGQIATRNVQFWVTEFSWDTKPPDPKGVPLRLDARWVAEALYRMWSQGVSLVTWFTIRDQPFVQANPYATPYQSGLYFRSSKGIGGDQPKLAFRAFRFPFVAFPERGGHILLWGRTPPGARPDVVVEQMSTSGWRQVAALQADRFGIFSGRIASTARSGYLRARLANGSDVSVPFGLRAVPDQKACVFGLCY